MDTSSSSTSSPLRSVDREIFRGSNNTSNKNNPQNLEIGSDAVVFADDKNIRNHHRLTSGFEWYQPNNQHVSTPSSYNSNNTDGTGGGESNDSQHSIPPLEDVQTQDSNDLKTGVKVCVGIDDDLQMILDLDPGIVDLGSTPTTEPKIVGLPPLTGGYVLQYMYILCMRTLFL